MSDIPVFGEQDELQATVTDQMLNDPSSNVGDFLPTASGIDLNTFNELSDDSEDIVGTSKSYPLKGLSWPSPRD